MDLQPIITWWYTAGFLLAIFLGQSLQAAGKFTAVWNVPSASCNNFGIHLDPEKYGIVTNKGQQFNGDNIVVFYNLGIFPQILSDGSLMNGGVPQKGDLDKHLQDAQTDILKSIPDKDFDGLDVIDFEAWRPVWSLAAGTQAVYKNLSLRLIKEAHPSWTPTQVEALAKSQFQDFGRKFLTSTLELAKRLRPKAKWGYYGYPYCNNYGKGEHRVSQPFMKANDELTSVFADSTSLYPSIYVMKGGLTSDERKAQVQGRIKETIRVRKNQATPVFPYFWYSYHDVEEFLTSNDLKATIGTVHDNGLNGIVIWGTTSEVNSATKCQKLKNYLDATLGPYVKSLQG